MTKIVLNRSWGSFALSAKAYLRLKELGWVVDAEEEDLILANDRYYPLDLARTDLRLIQTLEELGEAAAPEGCCLVIEEIAPGTRYFVREHDGAEILVREEDIQWSVA
jgi:hypothetical protein